MNELSMSNKTDFYFWLDKQPKIREKRKSVDRKFNAQIRLEPAKKQAKRPLGYRIAGSIDNIIPPSTQAALENPIVAAISPFLAPLVLLSGCGARSGLLYPKDNDASPKDGEVRPDVGIRSDVAFRDHYLLDSRHADSKPDLRRTDIQPTDSYSKSDLTLIKDSKVADTKISDALLPCPKPNSLWLYKLQGKIGIGSKVVVDNNGNSYIVGTSGINLNPTPILSSDAYVAKFDPNGKTLWQNSYKAGYNWNTSGKDISLDQSGNVVITGEVEMYPKELYPFVSKFDSGGNKLWETIIGTKGMSSNGMTLAPDGSIYLTGGFAGNLPNLSDILINKIDQNGKYLWNKLYNHANSNDRGEAIASDSSGNLYITGVASSTYPQDDIFIGKFDSSGSKIWTKTYGTNSWDSGFGIAVDKAGNVHVAGAIGVGGGALNPSSWVSKHDTNGNLIWQNSFYGSLTSSGQGYGISVDNPGNVFVTGYGFDSNTLPQAESFIFKYSPSGKLLWNVFIGGMGKGGFGKGITADNQGHLLVAGAADIDTAQNSVTLWVGKFYDCP